MLDVDELGDADSIPRSKFLLRKTARQLVRRDIIPQDDGWIGRYLQALAAAAMTLERQPFERHKKRDLGR
jgi:hypothetical protein